jgi:hypothetical protein
MASSPRQLLITALRDNFIPVISKAGWLSKSTPMEFDGPELRWAQPLGCFRRYLVDKVQAVDIFFDKHSPRFRVSIGTLPLTGKPSLLDPSVAVPPEALSAQLASDGRLLRPGLLLGESFGFRLFSAPSPTEAAKVSHSLIRLWPQVEDYFATGHVGSNLFAGAGLKISRQKVRIR